MNTTGMSLRNTVRAGQEDLQQAKRTNLLFMSGPIARVAPTHLITSDADLWARVSAVRSPYRRAAFFYHAARFEVGKDNIFTECDNDRHDARRKKMAAGVSDCRDCKSSSTFTLSLLMNFSKLPTAC